MNHENPRLPASRKPSDLLEPDAVPSRTSGSERAPARQRAGATRLKRTSIVAASVSTLLIPGAGTALADVWGGVDCDQASYAGCRLGTGKGVQPEQPPSSQQPDDSDDPESDGNTPPRPQGDQIVGDPNLANCRYVRSNYQPPSQGTATIAFHPPRDNGGAITATPAVTRVSASDSQVRLAQQQPPPGQPGAWYVYQCSGQGFADTLYRAPIWIPDGTQPGPSPEQLAQQAYNQLRLPSPQIHASPAETQLVNLPTWLWMDPGQWQPQSSTASVPGVSVTATAVPRSVTWSMGDGSTITCQGAGSPFPSGGDPKAVSPDCGHTYRTTSQGQPNNTYAVAATVHWTVTWSGAGQGGTFPNLTTTSDASFAVAESQALNNAPR